VSTGGRIIRVLIEGFFQAKYALLSCCYKI
jgi:hypothetical protein